MTGQAIGATAEQASAPSAPEQKQWGLRRAAAGVTASTLVALVACDLRIGAVRTWWDRHSFTGCVVSSLLVVGVTALIFDEVVARRQRKERSVSVAVQSVIVYGQVRRTYDAILAATEIGAAAAEPKGTSAPEEMRSLANMLLVASPALFDDPLARVFLEEVQRLAGSMYRALSSAAVASRPALTQDSLDHLRARRSMVDTRFRPLAARVPPQDLTSFDE